MRVAILIAVGCCIAGCASGPGSLGGDLAPYAPSNAFYPVGYSESSSGDGRYQVRASGTASTPYERIEKIATARAAEIGATTKAKYFKVVAVTRDASCTRKKSGYKVTDTAASARPTVSMDVVFAPTAIDPSYQPSQETFDRLSAEMKTDSYPPESGQATAEAVKARCGV
ncbi:MAG: CC0125/CC1285 family lipoprotein [Hyphomicrobium sp.]